MEMKRLAPFLVIALVGALPLQARGAASPVPMSAASMPACPENDPVVWVNTQSKVYHAAGTTYFGRTKHGKYLCTSAAVQSGAHAAKGEKTAGGVMPSGAPAAMSSAEPMSSPEPSKKHRKKSGAMTPTASPTPM
jgi:hypothetical protein